MGSNVGLNEAKDAKRDEFYTQLEDVAAEMEHYEKHFRGKVIYCNCDDPAESSFFHYFAMKAKEFKIKSIITTCYRSDDADLFTKEEADRSVGIRFEGGGLEWRPSLAGT